MPKLLGGKPLDDPVVAVAPVAQPVMQPVAARLPELDRFGDEQVPAPEVGHGNLGRRRPALLQFLDAPVKLRTGADDLRLPAGPGAELRSPGPGPEVRLAAGLRHHAHAALGGDLAAQGVPGEDGTGPRMGLQVLALA